LSKYDPSKRRGFTLNIKASSGGYQSQGDDKHVYFGIWISGLPRLPR